MDCMHVRGPGPEGRQVSGVGSQVPGVRCRVLSWRGKRSSRATGSCPLRMKTGSTGRRGDALCERVASGGCSTPLLFFPVFRHRSPVGGGYCILFHLCALSVDSVTPWCNDPVADALLKNANSSSYISLKIAHIAPSISAWDAKNAYTPPDSRRFVRDVPLRFAPWEATCRKGGTKN